MTSSNVCRDTEPRTNQRCACWELIIGQDCDAGGPASEQSDRAEVLVLDQDRMQRQTATKPFANSNRLTRGGM